MLEFGYLFIWINLFFIQRLSGELRCTELKGDNNLWIQRVNLKCSVSTFKLFGVWCCDSQSVVWGALRYFWNTFCGICEFVTINNSNFILMFLSSSLTVTEVYVLCLLCFHIRRNGKIELENTYFVALAIWIFFFLILKPVNRILKFRTCMILAQKSVFCTEQNLNKYYLNKCSPLTFP